MDSRLTTRFGSTAFDLFTNRALAVKGAEALGFGGVTRIDLASIEYLPVTVTLSVRASWITMRPLGPPTPSSTILLASISKTPVFANTISSLRNGYDRTSEGLRLSAA